MDQSQLIRVHVITGGFPPGSAAGHDMDYARLQILRLLQEVSKAAAQRHCLGQRTGTLKLGSPEGLKR
jgi:hypothetical protein